MTTFQVGDTVLCRPSTIAGQTTPRKGVVNEVDLDPVTRYPYAVIFEGRGQPAWYMPGELTLVEKAEPLKDDEVYEPPLDYWVKELPTGDVILNPEDPFEAVLVDIVTTNRNKRKDYAVDGSPWSNFEFTAGVLNLPPVDAAVHNVAQKLARLTSLRANGRMADPANEAVTDTYLDMAVYATIAYAIHRFPSGKVS